MNELRSENTINESTERAVKTEMLALVFIELIYAAFEKLDIEPVRANGTK